MGQLKIFIRLVLGLCIILTIIAIVNLDVFFAFTERMASGFTGAAERGGEDGSRALVGLARYPLMGEGLGFFSLGAERLGGQIYYIYMAQFGGGGENSWLSTQGEAGILGVMFYALALLLIVIKSYKNFKVASRSRAKDVSWHLAATFFPIAMSLWALTHHVFSNYLQMMSLFFLFGASVGVASNMRFNSTLNHRNN
jgi:hypothetical protein